MSRITAKSFKPKRWVSLMGYSRNSKEEYTPEEGDIVYKLQNTTMTEHILGFGFHIEPILYVGFTWSDFRYSMLWKPMSGGKTAFYGDFRDFYPATSNKDGWRGVLDCFNYSFTHNRSFKPYEFPCKVENFRKYVDINVHSMETVHALELGKQT